MGLGLFGGSSSDGPQPAYLEQRVARLEAENRELRRQIELLQRGVAQAQSTANRANAHNMKY